MFKIEHVSLFMFNSDLDLNREQLFNHNFRQSYPIPQKLSKTNKYVSNCKSVPCWTFHHPADTTTSAKLRVSLV